MNKLVDFSTNYIDNDEEFIDILNVSNFNDDGILINQDNKEEKKKRSKKNSIPKSKKIDDNTVIAVPDTDKKDLAEYQSNEPYIDSYNETNNMLKASIAQIDNMQMQLNSEMEKIRSSNTLRKKYDYIAMMTDTSSHLIGTKVTAIREMNKTLTDCHNLELRRVKDLKLNETEVNDDKYIMDMYNAFISSPVGNYSQLGPSSVELNNSANQSVNGMIGQAQYSYNDYMNNLNPAQKMMLYEQDPNIKVCVMYDQATGARFFQVINRITGEPVPGAEVPDPMFLEDLMIDVRNGIARNKNLDITYDLVLINGNSAITEY